AQITGAAYATNGLGIAQAGLAVPSETPIVFRVVGRSNYPYIALTLRDGGALDTWRNVKFTVEADGTFDVVLDDVIPVGRTLTRVQIQAASLGGRPFVVGDYIEIDAVAVAESALLTRRRAVLATVDGVERRRSVTAATDI
nr:hypothetical protein [Euzebyales bacterium]